MGNLVLKEDNENRYAKAIHEVEDLMRKNYVVVSYIGGCFCVSIKDKEFRLDSSQFPRMFEEEKLEPF